MKRVLFIMIIAGSSLAVKAQSTGDTTRIKIKLICGSPRLSLENSPIYIVNDKLITSDSLSLIDTNQIKSIRVMKELEARSVYGDKGRNGAVAITLKTKKED